MQFLFFLPGNLRNPIVAQQFGELSGQEKGDEDFLKRVVQEHFKFTNQVICRKNWVDGNKNILWGSASRNRS